jgi:tetratricopeptide (TPR) repeat protein
LRWFRRALIGSAKNWSQALFPSLHHRKEGWLRHQSNVAQPPKQTQTGWFSFCLNRKTTPASLPAEASRHFINRSATPPCGDARRGIKFVPLALASLLGITAYAEVPSWVQWLPSTSPALGALYRMVPSLSGSVAVRRPPGETVAQLAAINLRNPSDTETIALIAREYEAQLDFVNAEARWKLLDSVSPDHVGNQIQLADYYHRRMQPEQELQALTTAATLAPAVEDPLQPQSQQSAWKLHERAQQLIQAEAMPVERAVQDYDGWTAKYPGAEAVQRRYFEFLLNNGNSGMISRAEQVLSQYERAFPNDRLSLVRARAQLAEKRGSRGGATAVYDAAYDPLWPQAVLNDYFRLLDESHKSFDFYENARRAAISKPLDVDPATRLFHYYRRQNDVNAARRELSEFRVRKETAKSPWKATELSTLAKLAEAVTDYDEAIRYSYALYSLPGADSASLEAALVEIINVLLKAPDQPIRFGRGDLSFYRDIATIDTSPGFLNGILSLIFNSQYPDGQFRSQERKSEAYFHRAKAAELYKLLSERFPKSAERSGLLARLIESYAFYGEDEAIIRQGTAFITEFADAQQRTRVALQVADAYARRKQVPDELGIYNRLLGELAAKAQQVPLGSGQPRSPEYAQVLQRYISRLSQLNRINDALALYRGEIGRNPNDPGLYDGLASFLGSNQRAGEIEQVYRQAMQRFQDRSWRSKLARFYLRNRMSNELRTLSNEMVDTFAGSDVEAYIADVTADGSLERRLQLDINLYALNRFPHDLRFVDNLISLYSTGATANAAAQTRLLSEHWYEDENIRRMYFERLAANGALSTAVQNAASLLPPASAVSWRDAEAANPLVTRFLGEAAAWQSHFESAATMMQAVATAYPSDTVFAGRASELYRSLSAYDKNFVSVAVDIADGLSRSAPRDRQRLARVGEIYADHEMSGAAATVWKRIPAIEPGKPDSYLETATVFWDYLQPSDALDWLRRGRVQQKNPVLWPYETGAILESQGLRQQAVTEYIQGALTGSDNRSRARLLALAPRRSYRALVDDQTKRRLDAVPANPNVLALRVAVFRAQRRDSELEPLLAQVAGRTSSREMLDFVKRVANESGLRSVYGSVLRREIQLESDPAEKLRLGTDLARFLETGGDAGAAQAQIESIYQSNPLISGVIRATADYYWRHDKPRAVRVLAAAAGRANISFKKDYLIETVRKAIDAGQPAEAVQAAAQLLQIDPIDSQSVALMADALSAGGRQAELQQLYTAKISEIQQAKIAEAEKTDRIAAMRRGLIPVLVRESKFREAIDQYIEIINRFPDDTNLLSEAGRFASQHNLRPQLLDYYTRTTQNSPRDPRWFIVLARLQTQFGNYPAAIDAYAGAIAARPERQDLAVARADLEERTSRFADAIVTYNRIFELSHRNPIWLEHIARLQARLGQNREAASTLQRAYIDNRPQAERQYEKVAFILEDLGMIGEAADFVRQQPDSVAGYVRLMARTRRYDDAIQRVFDRQDANAARVLGNTVAKYFTPEEKQAFLTRLTPRTQTASQQQRQLLINIADPGRLYDLAVALRLEEGSNARSFEPLQETRMRFAELARQLEDLAARSPVQNRLNLLMAAMRGYQTIGAAAAELQLFSNHPELQVNNLGRYYQLLAEQRPDELLNTVARSGADSSSLAATQAFIAAGDRVRAMQAIERQRRSPVWTNAYTGLTGLYFGLNSPDVAAAFQKALGSPVIEDRLGKPVDRASQLAGNVWFYYGQRYGEYLRDAGQGQAADDYLWSELESRPGNPEAYLQIARYYQETGEPERAITEFRHALELDAKRAPVHSEIAIVLWDAGRRNEALTEWKTALDQFADRPNPSTGAHILSDIRSRRQENALHAEIDKALRAAARAFQVWELPEVLRAAFEGSTDDQWLLDIVQASRAPVQLMTNLANPGLSISWSSSRQQKLMFESAMNLLSSSSLNRVQYLLLRQQYLGYLLDQDDAAGARKVLDSYTSSDRRSDVERRAEVHLAALENKLADLLASYTQNPSEAPPDSVLQESAAILSARRLTSASQEVLEFLYSRQIENSGNPAAYLGLAEIRVKQGRLDQATDLLTTLNQIDAVPFEHLLASARLFSENGHPGEAQEFVKLRVQATPWDYEARLDLARVEIALNQKDLARDDLQKIVSSTDAAYDIRTQAAREEGKNRLTAAVATGSRELDLLSNLNQLTAANADAPFFFAARIAASEQNTDPNARVQLLSGAIAERPNDPDVRRMLFSAALEARQYRLALASNPNVYPSDSGQAANLAEAHQQIGEFGEAARLFRVALSLEKDNTRRQTLQDKAKQAQAVSDRRLEDKRRRPVMRADVDQPNIVRRRQP